MSKEEVPRKEKLRIVAEFYQHQAAVCETLARALREYADLLQHRANAEENIRCKIEEVG
jgi:hypothetical protein